VNVTRPLLLTLTALLAGHGAAQTAHTSLPQDASRPLITVDVPKGVSVGDQLHWSVGAQQYDLRVLEASVFTLTLIRPGFDASSYRHDAWGDENYLPALSVTTTYTLSDDQGNVLRRLTAAPGQLATTTLFSAALPVGLYHVTASTTGQGKHSFILSASGGNVSVSVPTLNATLHERTWMPLMHLTLRGDEQIGVYDSDGPSEMALRLRYEDGTEQDVTGGGNLVWQDYLVTKAGRAVLEARQVETAKQYSNSIALRLRTPSGPLPLHLSGPVPTPGAAPAPAPAVPQVLVPTPQRPVPVVPVLAAPPMPSATVTVPPPAAEPAAVPSAVPAPSLSSAPEPSAAPAAQVSAAPVAVQRLSTVTVRADVPQGGTSTVTVPLPAGAALISGSVTVEGRPSADPAGDGQGALVFTLHGAGAVTYQLSHTGPIRLLPATVRWETGEHRAPQSVRAETDPLPAERTGGLLRYPVEGQVIRSGVTAAAVQFDGQTPTPLLLNGVPVSERAIGRQLSKEDGSYVRREYVALTLRPGENLLQVGQETVRVRAPGPVRRVVLTPTATLADGKTPLAVRVQALDEAGLPSSTESLDLSIGGAQPLSPDGDLRTSGYQLRLTDGEGLLLLRPTSVPSSVVIQAAYGEIRAQTTFVAQPDRRTVVIGYGQITLPVPEVSGVSAAGAVTAEVPAGEGKLYLYADSSGAATAPANHNRFLNLGDAASETQPLTGQHGVAALYQHPAFTAKLALYADQNEVFGTTRGSDALNVTTRGDVRFSVTAAIETAAQTLTVPDATNILTLPFAPLLAGSVVLTLTTPTGQTVTLIRGSDYSVDEHSGLLILARPYLSATDGTLRVSYSLAGVQPTGVAYSAAISTPLGPGVLAATATRDSAATTVGVRYGDPVNFLRAAYDLSHGAALVDGSYQASAPGFTVTAYARAQSDGYQGPLGNQPGLNAKLSADKRLSPTFGVRLNATLSARTLNMMDLKGSVDASGYWVFGEKGQWSVGSGVRKGFGTGSNVQALIEGRYEQNNTGFALRLLPSLTGQANTAEAEGRVPLNPSGTLAVVATAAISEEGGRFVGSGSVGLDGSAYGVHYAADYLLPSGAGDSGALRTGVNAQWALSPEFSAGLVASVMIGGTGAATADASLTYSDHLAWTASFGVSASLAASRTTTVYGSAQYAPEGPFSVTARARQELGGAGGTLVDASATYRADALGLAARVKYLSGSYAPVGGSQLVGELESSYRVRKVELRAGVLTQTVGALTAGGEGGGLLTDAYVGGTYWLTDRLGLSAFGHAYNLYGETRYAPSAEINTVIAPGFGLSAGYNVGGYAWSSTSSRPGFYLRGELLFGGTDPAGFAPRP